MKTEINLLPIHPGKEKIGKLSSRDMWIMVVSASIVLFVAIYGILIILNQNCLKSIQQVDEVIKNKSEYQIVYQSISDQNELLEHQIKLKEAVMLNKDISLQSLIGVCDTLPTGVSLIEYTFIDGNLKVTGRTKNQEDIFLFKDQLMTRELFKNVSIQNTSKKTLPDGENKITINEAANGSIWEFTFEIQVADGDKN
jgi:hypothetical protein